MKKCLIWIMLFALLLTACGAPAADPAPTEPTPEAALPHEGGEAGGELAEPEIEAEPEPEAEPELAYDFSQIVVESETTYGTYAVSATLTATYLPTGEVLWTYTTPDCVAAQLETAQFVGIWDDKVYVNQQNYMDGETVTEEGGLAALDLVTGELLWLNADFNGASVYHCFGPDGTIYVTGFFGPDCCAIDAGGTTLWAVQTVNPDWMWPGGITLNGDVLEIRFTGGPEGDGEYYGYIGLDGTVQ